MEIPKKFTVAESIPQTAETDDEIDRMLQHMADDEDRLNRGKPPANLPF